jgi:hypothetical protein
MKVGASSFAPYPAVNCHPKTIKLTAPNERGKAVTFYLKISIVQ